MGEQLIYAPKSKITKETITVYGAGKFYEESLVLNKTRAMLLMAELHEFLKDELCQNNSTHT